MRRVGVLIPALNEEKTIKDIIVKTKKVLIKQGFTPKILVVDDGSTDNTIKEAKKAGALIKKHYRNRGLAQAYRTGIKELLKLNSSIIVQIDADGQYLPEEIPELIKPILKDNADLVLGSRFKGEIEEMSLIKYLGNKAFSKIISGISGFKISDAQTGFRAMNKEAATNIMITSTHTYTQEAIIKAAKRNYKIVEVPVFFARRVHGKSRLIPNPFNYAKRATLNLIRVYRDHQPLKFFGWIAIALILPSLILGINLIYLHLNEGISGHVPLLFLTTMLFLSGLQILLFGFMADQKKVK